MAPITPSRALSILVVDDEPSLRRLMRRALVGTSTIVVEAASAAEALERCREHAFSAVISDVRMPGMSGIDLVGELGRLYPGLPVIVVSGSDEVETRRAALAAGAYDFLPKPFRLMDLAYRTLSAIAACAPRRAVA